MTILYFLIRFLILDACVGNFKTTVTCLFFLQQPPQPTLFLLFYKKSFVARSSFNSGIVPFCFDKMISNTMRLATTSRAVLR